jgi:hypothetical protein
MVGVLYPSNLSQPGLVPAGNTAWISMVSPGKMVT